MALHQTVRQTLTDAAFDLIGSLALGAGIYCFSAPARIAPGGVSGLALLLRHLWGFPVGLATVALNLPILYMAFRRLGRAFTLRSLQTLLISSAVLDLLVSPFFPQYAGDRMLGSIFGGLFAGAGLGLIFLRGSTTAGTDILSVLIERRFPHVQLGAALMAVDCVVLGLSMLVFRDLEAGLFGLIALFCQSKMVNGIVYGLERGKQVLIVSEKTARIAARVIGELNRTATFLHSRGAFNGREGLSLLCVVRVQEYHRLKRLVYEEDPHAFLIATDTNAVHGEGFRELE